MCKCYNVIMVIALSLIRWWYGEGLLKQSYASQQNIAATVDYFSIPLLLKTLFSPFRQISAGGTRGPLGVQLRAWLDRLVSRCVGAAIRTLTIFVGVLMLAGSCVYAVLRLGGWLALPFLPAVGLVLMISGWMPWNL